jgi:hypothetical protein
MSSVARAALLAGIAATAAGTAMAFEDDLAVVKRAVAKQEARQDVKPAPAPTPKAAPDEEADADRDRPVARRTRTTRSGPEPQWLKVRVTEKGAKRAKVTVNLPIALVRALGDDFPLDFGERRWPRRERERVVRLGEVLALLESGQPLVEIDDDEALVKVWVE